MHCPFCGHGETRVLESRLASEGTVVRRRRACTACDRRFTTYERSELLPMVVKKDGRREAFDEQKLARGMLRALAKRPVPMAAVEGAVQEIRARMEEGGGTEIPAQTIGEWVMEALKGLDHVAYVRYASVYRRFADVSDFADAVEALKEKDGKTR